MLTRLSCIAAKRRWTLLLLLPYLLLCGFGEALHNHSPFADSRLALCAPSGGETHASLDAVDLSHDSEMPAQCLVCQWHAQAGAVTQTPFHYSPLAAVSSSFPSSSDVALSAHTHTLRTRGPPSHPFSMR